jgi:Ca2+/Na+ antiporter
MNKRYLIILEVIWIVTGILCLIAGIRYATRSGGNKTYIFFLLAIVSFLFAWLRDRERKK